MKDPPAAVLYWVPAQLPPQLATWLCAEFGHDAHAVRDLGLRSADDRTIFLQARNAKAILLRKDVDFVELVGRLGAPPKLIWPTYGNVSNEALRVLQSLRLDAALKVLESDDVVEVA